MTLTNDEWIHVVRGSMYISIERTLASLMGYDATYLGMCRYRIDKTLTIAKKVGWPTVDDKLLSVIENHSRLNLTPTQKKSMKTALESLKTILAPHRAWFLYNNDNTETVNLYDSMIYISKALPALGVPEWSTARAISTVDGCICKDIEEQLFKAGVYEYGSGRCKEFRIDFETLKGTINDVIAVFKCPIDSSIIIVESDLTECPVFGDD